MASNTLSLTGPPTETGSGDCVAGNKWLSNVSEGLFKTNPMVPFSLCSATKITARSKLTSGRNGSESKIEPAFTCVSRCLKSKKLIAFALQVKNLFANYKILTGGRQ